IRFCVWIYKIYHEARGTLSKIKNQKSKISNNYHIAGCERAFLFTSVVCSIHEKGVPKMNQIYHMKQTQVLNDEEKDMVKIPKSYFLLEGVSLIQVGLFV
ncbi:hypothetical protein, partial [Caedibacter taeniospiralis]|uniref:hypothetical protein n=1 Tax=Caedibacter taeniospiralis TaxID=28907 RepID=UPI001E51486B